MLPTVNLDRSTANEGSIWGIPEGQRMKLVRKLCWAFLIWLIIAVVCMYASSSWDWTAKIVPKLVRSSNIRSLRSIVGYGSNATIISGKQQKSSGPVWSDSTLTVNANNNMLNQPNAHNHEVMTSEFPVESRATQGKSRTQQHSTPSKLSNLISSETPSTRTPSAARVMSSSAFLQTTPTPAVPFGLRILQSTAAKIPNPTPSTTPLVVRSGHPTTSHTSSSVVGPLGVTAPSVTFRPTVKNPKLLSVLLNSIHPSIVSSSTRASSHHSTVKIATKPSIGATSVLSSERQTMYIPVSSLDSISNLTPVPSTTVNAKTSLLSILTSPTTSSPTVTMKNSSVHLHDVHTSMISSSTQSISQFKIVETTNQLQISANSALSSGKRNVSEIETSGLVGATTSTPAASVACKLPRLLIKDLSISQYLKTHKPLLCARMPNWVYSDSGNMYISSYATKRFGNIDCDYYDIYRKDDDHWDWKIHRNVTNGTELINDAFQVVCNSSSGAKYKNLHLGVPFRSDLMNRKPASDFTTKASGDRIGWNVLIYLMDSMSRVNFLRKLPKLSEYLSSKMGAVIMEGFNIVGDETPWTMIPVTTGHFQTELYEGRKRFSNSSYLDEWPLIFKDFKQAGYVTAYVEEQAQFSFYSYKLRGFREPPVDHYLRTFEQAVNYVRSEHRPYCLGDKPRSIVLNNWWREFQDMYRPRDIKTFSILFSSETSHDDYNLVQTLDEHWENVFREQFEAGYFNDTFLVVMGDHGRRFGPIRATQTGKMEEKLPFLALVAPPTFKKDHPRCWKNLLANTNRLVTPFDLHRTLQAILHFDSNLSCAVGNISQRGIPLFQEICPSRSCRDAWIRPHFCSCLEWEPIPDEKAALQATNFVLQEFNNMIAAAGNFCAPLRLDRIVWSRQLHPNHNLMAFKESEDYDNIFPDLTANTKLTSVLYQIRFVALPSNADYEVSVTHYVDLNRYAFSSDEVSRLDMYGDQPHCIMNTHQHLRQYCICKDKVSTM